MPKFKAYYAKDPTFHSSGEHGVPLLTIERLPETHVFVRQVEAASLDGAFWNMQAEVWSPNGEAEPLIRELGLKHTSMSVGDVLEDPFGTCWECLTWHGWRAVESEAG